MIAQPTPHRSRYGICALAVVLWATSVGCNDQAREEASPSADAGIDGGRAEPLSDGGCNLDLSRFPVGRSVSFVDDVMPIFGLSCNTLYCHADPERVDMYLGPPCRFNLDRRNADEETGNVAPAETYCEFNVAPAHQQDPVSKYELTDEIVARVLASLVGVPSEVAPEVNRITPGDPAKSFLVHKVSGTHDDQGYACKETAWSDDGDCGNQMPPLATLCYQNGGQARVDTIAEWIAQGASGRRLDCEGAPDGSPCGP